MCVRRLRKAQAENKHVAPCQNIQVSAFGPPSSTRLRARARMGQIACTYLQVALRSVSESLRIVDRMQTLGAIRLFLACCFPQSTYMRITCLCLCLKSTHSSLATWYLRSLQLWSKIQANFTVHSLTGCLLCGHVAIITKPSLPFLANDIVMVPGLLLSFLHSCEMKSGSGLGIRLLTALQKQSCYFSQVFGYYSCMTILTMKFYECSAGKDSCSGN